MQREIALLVGGILFLVVVVIARIRNEKGTVREDPPLEVGERTDVAFTCSSKDDWREAVFQLLSRSRNPKCVKVHVFVECSGIKEVTPEEAIDPSIRGSVTLTHIKSRKGCECPITRMRRATKWIKKRNEGSRVVFVDWRARLVADWDVLVSETFKHIQDQGGGVVVTSPTASRKGKPRFPTRRVSESRGCVVRGEDRKFACTSVPFTESVCICTEFCVLDSKMIREISSWPPSPILLTDHIFSLGGSVKVVTFPVVAHDTRIEDDISFFDEGSKSKEIDKCEKVGLTKCPTEEERIVKFGSCSAAKLTLQFL